MQFWSLQIRNIVIFFLQFSYQVKLIFYSLSLQYFEASFKVRDIGTCDRALFNSWHRGLYVLKEL